MLLFLLLLSLLLLHAADFLLDVTEFLASAAVQVSRVQLVGLVEHAGGLFGARHRGTVILEGGLDVLFGRFVYGI